MNEPRFFYMVFGYNAEHQPNGVGSFDVTVSGKICNYPNINDTVEQIKSIYRNEKSIIITGITITSIIEMSKLEFAEFTRGENV